MKPDTKNFTHRNVVYLFIACELDIWSRNLNTTYVLGDCLFEAVKLTKNADLEKYQCNGYGIGFDMHLQFS